VTFGLSHVNLMINKDILVKNTQIFIYFNYSLKLMLRAKTSKKNGGSYFCQKKKKEMEGVLLIKRFI